MLYIWILCIFFSAINIKYNNGYLKALSIGLMVFLMSCNNKAGDEINLYADYQKFGTGNHEIYDFTSYVLSELIERPFAALDLSFGTLNVVCLTIAFCIIHIALRKIKCNDSLVYFLFCISSILLDTTLFRQFLGFSVAFYAFSVFITEKNCLKKYISLILVASGIHFSMIIFLSFIMTRFASERMRKIYVILGIILILLAFINGNSIPGFDMVLSNLGGVKMLLYMSSLSQVQFGWIYTLVVWGTMFYCSVYMFRRIKKSDDIMQTHVIDYEKIKIINYCISIAVILVIFSMLTMVSSRMLRPISWMMFVEYSLYLKVNPRKNAYSFRWIEVAVFSFIILYSYIFNHVIFFYDVCGGKVLDGIPFWDDDYSQLEE